jgi:hypothetical protein
MAETKACKFIEKILEEKKEYREQIMAIDSKISRKEKIIKGCKDDIHELSQEKEGIENAASGLRNKFVAELIKTTNYLIAKASVGEFDIEPFKNILLRQGCEKPTVFNGREIPEYVYTYAFAAEYEDDGFFCSDFKEQLANKSDRFKDIEKTIINGRPTIYLDNSFNHPSKTTNYYFVKSRVVIMVFTFFYYHHSENVEEALKKTEDFFKNPQGLEFGLPLNIGEVLYDNYIKYSC